MRTHPFTDTRLIRGLLVILVGVTADVLAGCQRGAPPGSTAQASKPTTTSANKDDAPATASATGQAADGGSAVGEAVSYGHLEGLYKDLAKTAPGQRWASMAQQMAYMHQLASQGGATGVPGPMGPGGGMMGGQRGAGPGMMGSGGGMMGGGQPSGGPGMMGPQGGMMMGGQGMMWQRACGLDEWNRGMAAMSRKDAEAARAAGDAQRARTLDEVAEEHGKLADQIGSGPSAPVGTQGAEIFAATCAPCHRPQGEGVPSAFPALRGDPVVNGPDERLIQVVLGGLNEPLEIGGQHYFGVMPPFAGRLDDATLATLLTYIRGAWGNNAPPVTPQRVAAVRR